MEKKELKLRLKYVFKHYQKQLYSVWKDFRRYGWGLGRKGNRRTIANFTGHKEQLYIYLKRRTHNKNSKAKGMAGKYAIIWNKLLRKMLRLTSSSFMTNQKNT